MPKLRKLRRQKKFRTNVNRKRLRNKQNKLVNINCKPIKDAWDGHKSVRRNIADMGLVYDPNADIKNTSSFRQNAEHLLVSDEDETNLKINEKRKKRPKKSFVCEMIEEETKIPRKNLLKLPKSNVEFLTYYMDKYNLNYKSMSMDPKNIYQETWKQFRAKIRKFMKIPEQFEEYLEHRQQLNLGQLGEEYDSDGEL